MGRSEYRNKLWRVTTLRWVCVGGRVCVGVKHGMVEVKLLCFRWLSPFLKLV